MAAEGRACDRDARVGICLGHQIIGFAAARHVQNSVWSSRVDIRADETTGRVRYAPNHGYAVEEESVGGTTSRYASHLHDGTVEGLRTSGALFSAAVSSRGPSGPRDSRPSRTVPGYEARHSAELVRVASSGGDERARPSRSGSSAGPSYRSGAESTLGQAGVTGAREAGSDRIVNSNRPRHDDRDIADECTSSLMLPDVPRHHREGAAQGLLATRGTNGLNLAMALQARGGCRAQVRALGTARGDHARRGSRVVQAARRRSPARPARTKVESVESAVETALERAAVSAAGFTLAAAGGIGGKVDDGTYDRDRGGLSHVGQVLREVDAGCARSSTSPRDDGANHNRLQRRTSTDGLPYGDAIVVAPSKTRTIPIPSFATAAIERRARTQGACNVSRDRPRPARRVMRDRPVPAPARRELVTK